MALRISFYAVDLVPFDQVLSWSLADLLSYVGEKTAGDAHGLALIVERCRHWASPQNAVFRRTLGQGQDAPMSGPEVAADPCLAISCKEYLQQGTAGDMKAMLGALAECSTFPSVQELESGYKRWWIGSLLDWVELSQVFESDEYAQYEDLFFKVLCGHSCGKLPAVQWSRLSGADFPVVPASEDVVRMGVWTPEELDLFVLYTQMLLTFKPQFGAAPGFRTKAATEPDPWWNEWVHRMLGMLLNIETLGYDRPNMVSFIG
jgi:hypothetical protein